MCGIVGILDPLASPGGLERRAMAMAGTLGHRGPDGTGVLLRPPVALGHCRLSILDLSVAGSQPMADARGELHLVFNGEIYNHAQLRDLLETEGRAPAWRGHSDTEILLACLAAWGPARTLARAHGMFALALWDEREQRLTLARDRFGEKPLYYGTTERGGALFASELRALRACGEFSSRVDRDALASFLGLACVPGERTIHEQARQLPPGTLLTLDVRAQGPLLDLNAARPEPYFSLAEHLAPLVLEHADLTEDLAADRLETMLARVAEQEMVADVDLGALLSGGLDSSLVTAIMQEVRERQGAGKVRTFTIGFTDAAYDESAQARAVAEHLGTVHTELTARPEDGLNLARRMAEIHDEPFADPSQIPTRLVSGLVREQVTVCLTGDGGDEMFGGYNRHVHGPGLLARVRPCPLPLRGLAAGALRLLPASAWDRLGRLAPKMSGRHRLFGDKVHKLARMLTARDVGELHARLRAVWPTPERIVLGGTPLPAAMLPDGLCGLDPSAALQVLDVLTYLPDDVLTKVDRAAMSVSLETRAPYLDHQVALFGLSLPPGLRIRNGTGKYLLRKLLARRLPPALFERPKMGFGVPLAPWLRGELKPWADALLDPARLKQEGHLAPGPARAAWKRLLAGRDEEQYKVWALLMFQQWLEVWKPS